MADDDALSDSLSLESHEIDDDSFNEADSNEEMSGDDSIGGYQGAIQPYMFEPVDDNVAQHEDEDESEPDDDSARLQQNISEWCTCGNCIKMPKGKECVCCQEIDAVVAKCGEAGQVTCMTLHPGFEAVATNPWNMQAVYNSYKQQYGEMVQSTENKKYRYVSYRHFVQWCWGYLGKEIRVVLPSCVVTAIRNAFPSEQYEGFHLPSLA